MCLIFRADIVNTDKQAQMHTGHVVTQREEEVLGTL